MLPWQQYGVPKTPKPDSSFLFSRRKKKSIALVSTPTTQIDSFPDFCEQTLQAKAGFEFLGICKFGSLGHQDSCHG